MQGAGPAAREARGGLRRPLQAGQAEFGRPARYRRPAVADVRRAQHPVLRDVQGRSAGRRIRRRACRRPRSASFSTSMCPAPTRWRPRKRSQAAEELLAEGDTDSAIEKLAAALEVSPANDAARYDYLRALLLAGRTDEARVALEPVRDQVIPDPRFVACKLWLDACDQACRRPQRAATADGDRRQQARLRGSPRARAEAISPRSASPPRWTNCSRSSCATRAGTTNWRAAPIVAILEVMAKPAGRRKAGSRRGQGNARTGRPDGRRADRPGDRQLPAQAQHVAVLTIGAASRGRRQVGQQIHERASAGAWCSAQLSRALRLVLQRQCEFRRRRDRPAPAGHGPPPGRRHASTDRYCRWPTRHRAARRARRPGSSGTRPCRPGNWPPCGPAPGAWRRASAPAYKRQRLGMFALHRMDHRAQHRHQRIERGDADPVADVVGRIGAGHRMARMRRGIAAEDRRLHRMVAAVPRDVVDQRAEGRFVAFERWRIRGPATYQGCARSSRSAKW